MAWSGGDVFKFQQIERGKYTHLAMLGLEPQAAGLWICPKDLAFDNAEHQHRAESRWIQFGIGNPPKWLRPYGGDIDAALATCRTQLGDP